MVSRDGCTQACEKKSGNMRGTGNNVSVVRAARIDEPRLKKIAWAEDPRRAAQNCRFCLRGRARHAARYRAGSMITAGGGGEPGALTAADGAL
jgi:hypothetical protein